MTKNEAGIWETTVGPVEPGAYRYNFVVDGVTVIDPASPFTSESNTRTWSMVTVPGADNLDTRNVPHGAVAAVTYYSTALKGYRRMHVYTPPGYEANSTKYPVFYLLHGAGDSDDSWTSVGRAGFILDNLIADKKAKPMVVVMPAGHTFRGQAAGRNADAGVRQRLHQRRRAVRREELPRADRPRQHRDCRPVDGRQPDAAGRHPAAREVRLHRRLQLRPARRVPGHDRPGRPRRGAAHPVRPRRPALLRRLRAPRTRPRAGSASARRRPRSGKGRTPPSWMTRT